MAEPSSLSSFSPLSAHPVARGPRLPHGLHPSLRESFDEDILDVRPAGKPARPARRPHPPAGISRTSAPTVSVPAEAIPYRETREPELDTEPDTVPQERSAQRPPAEKTLRVALLAGLCLNLVAFLMVGLSLPEGELTRNDALLAAATLLPALIMLVVGEFCRQGGRQGGRQDDSTD